LSANVRVLDPDIIGITESWMDETISDAEMFMEGYDLFRCDRPVKMRGEGVLLCVKKELQAVKVDVIRDFPEQVWCKICVDSGYDLLIGVCYRTPTEQVFGKDNHSKLRDMLSDVSDMNFILMGDFNYRHIDWSIGACQSGATEECRLFLECLQDGFVTQHVTSKMTERSL